MQTLHPAGVLVTQILEQFQQTAHLDQPPGPEESTILVTGPLPITHVNGVRRSDQFSRGALALEQPRYRPVRPSAPQSPRRSIPPPQTATRYRPPPQTARVARSPRWPTTGAATPMRRRPPSPNHPGALLHIIEVIWRRCTSNPPTMPIRDLPHAPVNHQTHAIVRLS
jgi:hypothetical protein